MGNVILVILVILIIPFILFLIYFFGSGFRQWNEGSKYKEDNWKSVLKTIIIGLIIFAVIGFIMLKCGGEEFRDYY